MAETTSITKKGRVKKEKEEPKTCPVCMDHFTPIIRQAIVCPFCPHALCRQCCSRYLLTSLNDPHCMGCKREWNREFIDIHLTQTFRKGPLRQHRRRVLMDREKGRLPAMQVFVEAQKTIEQSQIRIIDLRKRRIMLKRQKDNFVMWHKRPGAPEEYRTTTTEELQAKIGPIDTERAKLKEEKRTEQNALWEARRVLTGEARPEARQFIMKCPAEECRGFLSTAWKCGTCQNFFCADCHAQKAAMKDEEHTCKEDAKATASLIRQETRPCPKCGIRISKIDGCFAKDTPVLLWNGTVKMSQDISVGDVLIGDDGESRTVTGVVSGEDTLYEVSQKKGMTYTTNSKHKLALKLSGDRKLSWMESIQAWNLKWLDIEEKKRKTKKLFVSETKTKAEAYDEALILKNQLPENDVMEITIDDYMKLPSSFKKELMGFKSTVGVNWEKKDVLLDPYVMGLYIGDGINDGLSFAINAAKDREILDALTDWASNNDCSIKKDDTYRYRLARNNHSVRQNPLKKALDQYNLTRSSKSIPNVYLVNDREVRLQLLAGIIDTDGFVSENGKRVVISQSNHDLGNQIAYLGRSLGYNVWIDFVKKENICWPTQAETKCYSDHIRICMSGEHLSEIPTRLPRKKCVNSTPNKDWSRSSLQIQEMGKGQYFGWSVTGNKRFLLQDFTVVRNCDQMWCTSCQTTFSWNTGQILLNTVVHNPHYYEYLRRVNNGAIPREAGDVPCGGLPGAYTLQRIVHDTGGLTADERLTILNCHRCLSDIQHVRLPQYPLRLNANVHRDIDIAYLLNKITEEDWGFHLERTETNAERRREIGLILQTLLHVGSEKFTAVQNSTSRAERLPLFKQLLVEMKQVLEYTNKSFMEKGLQMGIVVPHISDEWYWRMMRRQDMKPKGSKSKKKGAPKAQTEEVTEEAEATSDTPAVHPPQLEPAPEVRNVTVYPREGEGGAGLPAERRDYSDSEEEDRLIDVELPDGERVRMTAEQAREILGAR